MTNAFSYNEARPLRDGEPYCQHHTWQGWQAPDDCVRTGCAAYADAHAASDLGLAYCNRCKRSWKNVGGWCNDEDKAAWYVARGLVHNVVRCNGTTSNGERCRISSMHSHAGAQLLRDGGLFCSVHVG